MKTFISSWLVLAGIFASVPQLHAQTFYLYDTVYVQWDSNQYATPYFRIVDWSACELAEVEYPSTIILGPLSESQWVDDVTRISFTNSIFDGQSCPNVPRPGYGYIPDGHLGRFTAPYHAPSVGVAYAPETVPKGIVAHYTDTCYLLGQGISRIEYFDDNESISYLGDLPDGYQAAGQATLREGSYYYPSVNQELIQLKVRGDAFWLRSVGSLPDTLVYAGMLSVPHACDSTTTYLLHRDDIRGTTVYTVENFPDVTLAEYCHMPFKTMSAAYDRENVLPDCAIQWDLNTLNESSLNRYDTICGGTIELLDDNLAMEPDLEFDSLVVEIMNPLDEVGEWLQLDGTSFGGILENNQSRRITLRSSGFTRGSEFLEELSTLTYTNDLLPPSFGERVIQLSLYHPDYPVDTLFVYLTIQEGPFDASQILSDPSCAGLENGTIETSPSGGLAPYQYLWDDNSTAADRVGLSAGDYQLTLTDGANCYREFTFTLTEPDTLLAAISSEQDTICGNNGRLTATLSGGTAPYELAWSTGATGEVLTGLAPGIYQLTVTDANDCSVERSYELVAADTLFEMQSVERCAGETYSWQGQQFTQDTSFCINTTSVAGCDSVFCLNLSFAPTYFSEESFVLCEGESIEILGQSFDQDTLVNWTFTSEAGCDSIYQAVIDVLETSASLTEEICAGETYLFHGQTLSASGQYQATLTAASGCDSLITLDLVVRPPLNPLITIDGSLCSGQSVMLSSSGYASYSWNTGSQEESLSVEQTGTYSLSVTDELGCSGSASVELTESQLSTSWTVQQAVCADERGLLRIDSISGGQGDYALLLGGERYVIPGVVPIPAPGTYSATVEDAAGCLETITFTADPPLVDAIELADEYTIVLGDSVRLEPQIGFTPQAIRWQPPQGLNCTDCLTPTAQPTESTRYQLSLESAEGCVLTDAVLVLVEIKGVYLPNAFSPNDDGWNDVFTFYTGPSVEGVATFAIYDRWGAEVFRGTEGQWEWDGRRHGRPQPPGIFVYHLEWRDVSGTLHREQGEVLLLR